MNLSDNIIKQHKTSKNVLLNHIYNLKIDTVIISLIILLSFILNIYNIKNYGFGNEYYAAAIRSMSYNFKNFFFCSFDPSGILSVDKAPLGLWVQVAFVKVLGYKGFVLILPQAICSSLSSLLIYIMVKHYTNSLSALLSALFFAITPIVVATSRNNTIDMQLILVLLLSLLNFFKFIENNKLKYILFSAALIGVGFNIKMLQAYLILPAMLICYIIFCKLPKIKKTMYGIISCILIAAISLAWPIAVSLAPQSSRPYIDSTSNNSVFELIAGHNGIFRITGRETLKDSEIASSCDLDKSNDNPDLYEYNDYIGSRSIIRFFSTSIYGQISWLIIYAFIFLIILFKKLKSASLKQKCFCYLWSIYFVYMFIFFSFIGFFHRYYLCMIAPSICILAGQCIPEIISYYNTNIRYKKHLLSLCFLLTMIFEIITVRKFSKSPLVLIFLMIFLSAFTLFLIIINIKNTDKKICKFVAALSTITILCAPFYWCLTAIMYVPNVTKPSAGPEIVNTSLNISSIQGGVTTVKNNYDLEVYLTKNYKSGSFIAASSKTSDISYLIINTGLPVLSCNGFTGDIDYISLDKFKEYVDNGKIHYFIINNTEDYKDTEITKYVKENAELIDPDDYNILSQLKPKMESSEKNNLSLYCFNN